MSLIKSFINDNDLSIVTFLSLVFVSKLNFGQVDWLVWNCTSLKDFNLNWLWFKLLLNHGV